MQAVRGIVTSPEELHGLLDMLRAAKEQPQAAPAANDHRQEVLKEHENEST